MPSLYRRPLPAGHVAFASSEGRALFREAMAEGTLEGFFSLIEQFHTQAEPAYCGLGSLVMALNAFGIDPGRLWRGPWRWFSEELLDCCIPLSTVREVGISLDELACLARCNGADARVERPIERDPQRLRAAVETAARSAAGVAVIASYSRERLSQTGSGHFSPIGGYHAARDLVLLLDVARFKYPPHWVPLRDLYEAMIDADPATGRARGWIELRRRGAPSSLAYFVTCSEGLGIGANLDQLVAHTSAALAAARPESLAQVIRAAAASAERGRFGQCFALRKPQTAEHEQSLAALRASLTASDAHRAVVQELGDDASELITAWLLAAPDEMWTALPDPLAATMRRLVALETLPAALAAEVTHVRSQVQFLLEHARSSSVSGASTQVGYNAGP
jgi:glutathione gamma-glutamylcysteinyltransferase